MVHLTVRNNIEMKEMLPGKNFNNERDPKLFCNYKLKKK
jgi:hypothetical protein